MTTNAEGRFQYARSARHRSDRSQAPGALVAGVLILTFLPILVLLWVTVGSLQSFIRGTGITGAQTIMVLPFAAAALGAVVTGVLMKRAKTNRRAWAMALCTSALLLVAAFPPAYILTMTIAEELCESQPGGRGYSGPLTPEESPAVCGWARSD
jgi:membrane protease YdiL (CAAX protease family)